MDAIKYRISAFLALLGVWFLVMYPFSLEDLLLGAGIALLLVLLPLPGMRIYKEISLAPRRILYAILYLFVFLWAVVKSNIDVAARVLSPKMPINPGIVRVKTKLKTRLGRLILANSITLTPGTITVDIGGDELFIHWIDVTAGDTDGATKKIVSGFEKYLEVIFG